MFVFNLQIHLLVLSANMFLWIHFLANYQCVWRDQWLCGRDGTSCFAYVNRPGLGQAEMLAISRNTGRAEHLSSPSPFCYFCRFLDWMVSSLVVYISPHNLDHFTWVAGTNEIFQFHLIDRCSIRMSSPFHPNRLVESLRSEITFTLKHPVCT